MPKMLFSLIKSIYVPTFATSENNNSNIYELKIPATFSMRWPDGKPCTAVELFLNYLIDERNYTIREHDGGSLKVIVSDLTHIIRFCWTKKKGFTELYDEDFHEFVSYLSEEKDTNNPHSYKRDSDTVTRIINNTIELFFWIQKNLQVDTTLVGIRSDNPNITLKCKESYKTKYNDDSVRLYYPYQPTNETKSIKRPISRKIKLSLWDSVSYMSDPKSGGSRIMKQSKSHHLGLQKLEFLKKRREILLDLLETTGARPGELISLRASDLENCTDTQTIKLPSLKRRRGRDPIREIPIDPAVAIKLELFIHKHRCDLLINLRKNGSFPDPQDRLFISCNNGNPITKDAINKEFQRIVYNSGVTQKTCMSLFRHRFITNMVKIHLRAFLNDNQGSGKLAMTDSDYRTILKKVATFTGHANEMSLLNYIDLAWDELGIFDYVEPANKLLNAVEKSLTSITSIIGDVNQNKSITSKQLTELVLNELNEIKNITLNALNTHHY